MRSRSFLSLALTGLAIAVPATLMGCGDTPSASKTPLEVSTVASQRPDLSGTWTLNRSESDPPPRPPGRGPRPGDPQAGSTQGTQPPGSKGRRFHGPPGRFGTLVITQDESSVTFSRGGPRSNTLQTDGTTLERQGPQARTIHVTASWQDGGLVVVRSGPRGGTFTETYALGPDRDQLWVTTQIEGERLPDPIEFRRVYDRGS